VAVTAETMKARIKGKRLQRFGAIIDFIQHGYRPVVVGEPRFPTLRKRSVIRKSEKVIDRNEKMAEAAEKCEGKSYYEFLACVANELSG